MNFYWTKTRQCLGNAKQHSRDLWQQVQAEQAVVPQYHNTALSQTMLCSKKIELPIEKASAAAEKNVIFSLVCPT
jgi:hypothetical protein